MGIELRPWLSFGVGAVLSATALMVPAGPVHASGDPAIRIQNMAIDLRPEYDTSDVLIIYDFALTNTAQTKYDGEIQFHVPKGATNQVHICEQVNGNQHAICRPYNTSDAGDSTLMTWKPSKPIEPGQSYPIYVEYYYNPIQGTTDKTIDFLYHPSYQVDYLSLSVTQPLRSSNWKLDPAPALSGGTGDGMTRYNYTFQDVKADQPVKLAISYTKPDNKPSVAKTEAELSNARSLGTPAKIGIGAVMVAIFAGLLFLGLRRGPGRGPSKAAAKGAAKGAAKAVPPRGSKPTAAAPARPAPMPSAAEQRRKARQLLLEGKISEETFQAIIADLNAEKQAR